MADANEPLAYETVETPAPAPSKGFDYIQLGFWAALVVAGGAAGMALTWSDAVGPAGAVLVARQRGSSALFVAVASGATSVELCRSAACPVC